VVIYKDQVPLRWRLMAAKKLCVLVKEGVHKEDLKAYKELLRGAKYVCKKCGRAAAKSKCLCKAAKI
jgi:rubrerythrin